MLLNEREHVLKIVEALGSQEGIENIRVFSKKGVVMYSSRVTEIGTALTKQDSACTVCHGASIPLEKLSLSQRARFEKGTGQKHVLNIITPIPNETSCSTAPCHAHSPKERKLGPPGDFPPLWSVSIRRSGAISSTPSYLTWPCFCSLRLS